MEKSEQTHHEPSKRHGLTVGQRAADTVSNFVGSWKFIIIFISFLIVWMSVNVFALSTSWDPYPFILLNLTLSSIAALHAPIIMMSQNRQAERDRIRNEYDFAIDKKAEREIEEIQAELKIMQKKLDTLVSREVGTDKRLKKNST